MAVMGTMVGAGLTLTYTISTDQFEAQIINYDWSGGEVESLETTHMGTTYGARTFRPGWIDFGTLTVECHFDNKAAATKSHLLTNADRQNTSGSIVVTYPDPDGAGALTPGTFTCSGFVTNAATRVPLRGTATITYTFKLTAAPTVVATA